MVNVRSVERDQLLLIPPSLSEWLPPDHLAWLIVDVVAELDLSGFYRSLRPDDRGGTSYDPEVMLGVLLYAYCIGERSSRRIEQRLCDDVAFRVIAGNQQPDHAREDHSGGNQHNARCAIAYHAQPFPPAAMKRAVAAHDGSRVALVSKAIGGIRLAAIGIEPHPQQAGLGLGRGARAYAPRAGDAGPSVPGPSTLHR